MTRHRPPAGNWLVLVLLYGCQAPPVPPDAGRLLDEAVAALRAGRFETAQEFVQQAERADPRSIAVAEWASVLAELAWRDDAAIAAQRRAVQLAQDPAVAEPHRAALAGRLGELLFAAGRWGEATGWLETGAIGDEATRRRAFAAVSRALPYVRTTTGPFLSEQRLLPGDGPEFACGADGVQRSLAIDTGTSMTTFASTLAGEFGVRARGAAGTAVDGAGQALTTELGYVESFTVGEVDVGAWPVLVVADAAMRLQDRHGGPERAPRGVIGLDLLAAFRLTIDPERASIVLERPSGLVPTESVQCVRVEGRCLVPVAVEGVRLWFVLDTGASHSSLTAAGLAALPGGADRATPAFRRVRTLGGSLVAVREVRDLVLRVSEARFQGVQLPVVPRAASEFFPVHGVLGNDLLSRCRVTLDTGRARLTAIRT